MNDWSVKIMLKFPMMPQPREVQVSLRELHFIDRNAERRIEPDGTVIYLPPKSKINWDMCTA